MNPTFTASAHFRFMWALHYDTILDEILQERVVSSRNRVNIRLRPRKQQRTRE